MDVLKSIPAGRQGRERSVLSALTPRCGGMHSASRAGGGLRQAWRRGTKGTTAVVAAHDNQRAVAFSLQLRQAHQRLRDQLTGIRGELGKNEQVATELQVHCLAFCSALAAHHADEDGGMFAELLSARPDLAPAIQNLTDDHAAIAAILLQVRALAAQAKTAPAQALPTLRRELDGLAAIAESHFRYEERAIGAALDKALGGGSADRAAWPGPGLA